MHLNVKNSLLVLFPTFLILAPKPCPSDDFTSMIEGGYGGTVRFCWILLEEYCQLEVKSHLCWYCKISHGQEHREPFFRSVSVLEQEEYCQLGAKNLHAGTEELVMSKKLENSFFRSVISKANEEGDAVSSQITGHPVTFLQKKRLERLGEGGRRLGSGTKIFNEMLVFKCEPWILENVTFFRMIQND